jgi:hypothetical protein
VCWGAGLDPQRWRGGKRGGGERWGERWGGGSSSSQASLGTREAKLQISPVDVRKARKPSIASQISVGLRRFVFAGCPIKIMHVPFPSGQKLDLRKYSRQKEMHQNAGRVEKASLRGSHALGTCETPSRPRAECEVRLAFSHFLAYALRRSTESNENVMTGDMKSSQTQGTPHQTPANSSH